MSKPGLPNKILNWIPSLHFLQRAFKILHTISLRGMNYGGQGTPKSSGEISVLKYLNRQIKKMGYVSPVILDVGANLGDYSLAVNKFFNGSLKMMAFEPAEKTFLKLKDHLKNTDVKCFQFGFGDVSKQLKLYHGGDQSSQASLYKRELSNDEVETVTIRTIDDFCKEEEVDKIFFLKLDVEGNEYKALLGASRLIAKRKIQYIQFESGGTNIDSRVFFKDFWELLSEHYNLYRIVKDGLYPIKSYNESLEIFAYCNYFAALK